MIAVRRERKPAGNAKGKSSDETLYYATSLWPEEADADTLLKMIRQHWTIENRSHHRRDVTFNEDKCRVSKRNLAHVLASLRNLAIGLYELERSKNKAPKDSMASWCRRLKPTDVYKLLTKGSR